MRICPCFCPCPCLFFVFDMNMTMDISLDRGMDSDEDISTESVWCGGANHRFIYHSSLFSRHSSLVSLQSLLFISQSADTSYAGAYAGAHVRELSLLSSDTQRFKYLITILIKPTANEEEKLRGREEIMLKNRRFGFNKHLVTSNPPLLFSSFLFSSFLSLLSSSCPLLYLFSFSPIFFALFSPEPCIDFGFTSEQTKSKCQLKAV